jgi:hypothetical protein
VAAVAAVCLALGGVSGAVSVRAAEAVASNLDLMTQLTGQVVDELYTKFQGSLDGSTFTLRPFASGEDYVFVENVFASRLTGKGATVLEPPAGSAPAAGGNPPLDPAAPASSSAGYVLGFQTIAFGITYADVYRSHLVGGKHVRRRADVRLMATLSDAASGRVIWVGEAARNHEDEFEHGDAARIEQGTYQFVRPAMPSSGWGRYAEPVFVTGIIVGLIYLFFSNQSDN